MTALVHAHVWIGGQRLAVIQCLHIKGWKGCGRTHRPIVRLGFDQWIEASFLASILCCFGAAYQRIRPLRIAGGRRAYGLRSYFSVECHTNEDCERIVQAFGGTCLLGEGLEAGHAD